ncbi:MAG: hypothetical protein JW849_11155 [Phycisphaerae bacterium]|nr:hypothetical protein [Phycisphaerae bacterium]
MLAPRAAGAYNPGTARECVNMTRRSGIILGLLAAISGGMLRAEKPASPPAEKSAKPLYVRAEVPAPPLPKEITRAYVIPIHGEIDTTLVDVLKRKFDECKEGKAQIVIFDMDTPGGRSDAMNDISTAIQSDLKDVYTVAYVHPEAISAGAIIALACNEIVMAPGGVLGDAMPILLGPSGIIEIPDKERGKFESYARAKIRANNANGYNKLLCEAMITITLEVWLIENEKTHEKRIVDAREWRGKVADAPAMKDAPPVKKDTPWRYVETLDGPDELVTMTAEQAVRFGFAKHIFADMDELEKHYHIIVRPAMLEDTWSENVVSFLTSAPVVGLLVMLMLLFVYLELHTPGFVGFGALAVFCLAILIGSKYLTGLAQWWEIAVFGLGVLLLLAEIFLIPGFGVAGVSGILLMAVGLLAMLVPNAPDKLPWPETGAAWELFLDGLMALCLGFIGFLVIAAVLSRFLPKWSLIQKSRLILAPAVAAADAPRPESSPMLRVRAGDVGTTAGPLHPVGRVRFGEDLLDAVSEGEMIGPGRSVRVLRRDGNRIVVEEVKE